VTPEVEGYLNSRVIGYSDDFDGTRLFARNAKVEDFNMKKLNDLPGELHVFETRYEGHEHHVNFLKKNAPISEKIFLKVGAKVMMRRNDTNMRYVNGTTGTVTNITRDLISIELSTGEDVELATVEFEVKGDNEDEPLATAVNFPLSLAWATTIHKSQGCTLDKVLIDLRGLWESGQAYVALSRARSPEGVFLEGWHSKSIMADPVVTEFHRALLKA
jgi:ATP-dependent exoDNAse (exonuclease V) alpha subunit